MLRLFLRRVDANVGGGDGCHCSSMLFFFATGCTLIKKPRSGVCSAFTPCSTLCTNILLLLPWSALLSENKLILLVHKVDEFSSRFTLLSSSVDSSILQVARTQQEHVDRLESSESLWDAREENIFCLSFNLIVSIRNYRRLALDELSTEGMGRLCNRNSVKNKQFLFAQSMNIPWMTTTWLWRRVFTLHGSFNWIVEMISNDVDCRYTSKRRRKGKEEGEKITMLSYH